MEVRQYNGESFNFVMKRCGTLIQIMTKEIFIGSEKAVDSLVDRKHQEMDKMRSVRVYKLRKRQEVLEMHRVFIWEMVFD